MEPRHVIRRIAERAERGATFVEYALLGGVLALGSLASMQFLTDTASQGFEQSLNGVGTPIEVGAPGPSDPEPGNPEPETPDPEDPAPEDPDPEDPAPEDPAPEDPAPEAPGGDQPGNPSSGSRWDESTIEASREGRYDENVRVEATLDVYDRDGSPTHNGVKAEIEVDVWAYGRWWHVDTLTPTVTHGSVDVRVIRRTEGTKVRLRLTEVDGPPRHDWDGQRSEIVVEVP